MSKISELLIPGYDGDYTIDRTGVVRSYKTKNCQIVKPFIKNGYLYIKLSKNGKRKNHRVHRLVAEQFVHNPHPRKYKVVLHLDDDKLNPHADNLKWGTVLHNVRDMVKKGRHRNQHTIKTEGPNT